MINKEKLPKKFKDKWLAALRSGEYKQGRQQLVNIKLGNSTYCCLGVACSIVGISDDVMGSNGEPGELKGYLGKIPIVLRDRQYGIVKTLTAMNDTERLSFKKIANWIEEYL